MIRHSSRSLPPALCAAAFLLALLAPLTARAQDEAALRKAFAVGVPASPMAVVLQPAQFFRGAPGASTGSPMAFGPGWGDAFIGAGYQANTRGFYDPATKTTSPNYGQDASVSAGFGVGNPRSSLGLEVDITSLSTFHSGLGSRTAFSFKIDRTIDTYSAIAVGVENAFLVGGGYSDAGNSWYAVGSRVFVLPGNGEGAFRALIASVGVGNGRFRLVQDVAAKKGTVNAFASASLLIIDQLSMIADYTGQDLDLGLSIVPFKRFPVALTPAIADVTQTASKNIRFTMGLGVGMHF